MIGSLKTDKSRRTDPLPPAIDASPYRARPSGAALPLCEGENKTSHCAGTFSPSVRGRRERSERGGRLCRLFFLCLFVTSFTLFAAEPQSNKGNQTSSTFDLELLSRGKPYTPLIW